MSWLKDDFRRGCADDLKVDAWDRRNSALRCKAVKSTGS